MLTFQQRIKQINDLSEKEAKVLLSVIYARIETDKDRGNLNTYSLKEDLEAILELLSYKDHV
ncbi:hypothetical protein ACTHQ4_19990 [Alkalicoccobacillus gibsonii]|uniref:hypothetical protein n=1 Tax=Alkalicoccobacillus gibsonii TaxID=79881 RepID=UPI003F7C2A18